MEYSKDPTTNAIPSGTSQWNTPEAMAIAFAENKKAQIAARAIFELVHQYGDNLREGWKNVLDFLLYLLRANLLPSQMTEMEDFVDPRGHVPLKERFKRTQLAPKKEESGLFSWLGFSSSSAYGESDQYKQQTEEEKELCKKALNIILECHPEQMVPDSRYLASSALTELINNIIQCSLTMVPIPVSPTPVQQQEEYNNQTQQKHHQHESQGSSHSQDDDSIVDLSPAAALLPAEQNGQTNLQQQEQEQHAQLGHTESHLSAGSIGSSTSIIQQHINQPPSPSAHHQQQHYVPTNLSLDVEEALVFLLELIVNIVLENRDRLAQIWSQVRDHLHWLFTNFQENQQLIDRSVVAILRIANRNFFRLGQKLQPFAPPLLVTREKTTTTSALMTKSVVIVVENEKHKQPKMPKEVEQIEQTIQQRTNYSVDEVLQFMGHQLLALRPEVLFPLLARLLGSPPISPMNPIGMEEAHIRGIQLTCKIFLSHLTQISRLETFADLLRRLFDLMDQFLEGNACSDLLAEVIQESLKNCVLVCENFGIFQGPMEGLQVEMNERLEGLAKKHSYGLKMAL